MTTRSASTWTAATAVVVTVASFYYIRKTRRADGTKRKDADSSIASPQQALTWIQRRRSIFPKQYSATGTVPKRVLDDMLEAARWAPTHHLTEPWYFIVFETLESRQNLGTYLAEYYKQQCESNQKPFSEKKYQKKMKNCQKATYIICICVDLNAEKNPAVEEVCSVAAAVQNMHLVATVHEVGAYWSTSGIYAQKQANRVSLENSTQLRDFLGIEEAQLCVGWMFVGPLDKTKPWPTGRRKPCRVLGR